MPTASIFFTRFIAAAFDARTNRAAWHKVPGTLLTVHRERVCIRVTYYRIWRILAADFRIRSLRSGGVGAFTALRCHKSSERESCTRCETVFFFTIFFFYFFVSENLRSVLIVAHPTPTRAELLFVYFVAELPRSAAKATC